MALNLSTLKTPGVYIDEVPTLPSSIVGVETAIPAFIGYVEKMVIKGKDILSDATIKTKYARISSMKEYVDIFGGPAKGEIDIKVTIDETGKIEATKLVIETSNVFVESVSMPKMLMYYQLQMYFSNGGGPCYIVPAGKYPADNAPKKDDLKKTLKEMVEPLQEPTLILFPDGVNLPDSAALYTLYQDALLQCATLKDRFTIIDLKTDEDVENFRGDAGIGNSPAQLRYGAAYNPWLKTAITPEYAADKVVIKHTITLPEEPAAGAEDPRKAVLLEGKKLSEVDSKTAYYNKITEVVETSKLTLPPSASMAGVYAFTDNVRGVWKAPANVGINNVVGLSRNYTDEEQKSLNVDDTGGKSINIIRSFTGQGIVVWGARTLEGNSKEWRYVPIRRFFNFVEESVKKGMNTYVFEPNDANTWVKVKASIESFLKLQWQAGALQGSKPEQAFFVRVGLGQTMSTDDILDGRLIVDIGMAVVRPAEFIVLRFMHKLAEA